MATKSKVIETSFRFGCGRYIQENGAISRIGAEIARIKHSRPFIIGGPTALKITRDDINASLEANGMRGVFCTYEGYCNVEHCNDIIASEEFGNCDIVIGVGGGNCMDAAKYCAAMSQKPIINIPTSCATCAAYTPLSVMYNGIGQTVGTIHHKSEINALIADMNILSRQPIRLIVAGIYDSLAKLCEINQRLIGLDLDDVEIGLVSSYELSRFIYGELCRKVDKCCDDMANGRNTKTVYDVVYILIAITGIISGLARGSNQCAIAHKIYETTRTIFPRESRPYLHGELVGIGVLAQLYFNGEDEEENSFREKMKKFGMPVRLSDTGIDITDSVLEDYYNKIVVSSAMAGTTDDEKKKFRQALEVIR